MEAHVSCFNQVVLGTGDVVPADLRLFEAKDFKVSEMALTGSGPRRDALTEWSQWRVVAFWPQASLMTWPRPQR